jgi:beta-lactamase regulating signal transducer with metallopeptidase domain
MFLVNGRFGVWLANYYLAATILIGLALAVRLFLRHPGKKIALDWASIVGLIVLALLSALPVYPRIAWVAAERAAQAPEPPAGSPVGQPPAQATRPTGGLDPRQPMPGLEPPVEHRQAPLEAATVRLVGWKSVVAASFLAGSAAVFVWLLSGAIRTARLIRGASPAPLEVVELLHRLARGGNVPTALASSRVAQPAAVCAWWPRILIPRQLLEDASPRLIEAVLVHELAHVQAGDLWLNSLGRFLLLVLFANPLFWLLRLRIREDQESFADAIAANRLGAHAYAEELLALARRVSTGSFAVGLAMAERRTSLARRIKMLLHDRYRFGTSRLRRWRLASLAAGIVSAMALSAFSFDTAADADQDEPVQAPPIAPIPLPVEQPGNTEPGDKRAELADGPSTSQALSADEIAKIEKRIVSERQSLRNGRVVVVLRGSNHGGDYSKMHTLFFDGEKRRADTAVGPVLSHCVWTPDSFMRVRTGAGEPSVQWFGPKTRAPSSGEIPDPRWIGLALSYVDSIGQLRAETLFSWPNRQDLKTAFEVHDGERILKVTFNRQKEKDSSRTFHEYWLAAERGYQPVYIAAWSGEGDQRVHQSINCKLHPIKFNRDSPGSIFRQNETPDIWFPSETVFRYQYGKDRRLEETASVKYTRFNLPRLPDHFFTLEGLSMGAKLSNAGY